MPKDRQAPKELKVTDKRIFTPEGDIREEFREEIKPAEPNAGAASPQAPPSPAAPSEQATPQSGSAAPAENRRQQQASSAEERGRTVADKAANPDTPFTNFIEQLIVQGYMFLGMLRDPRVPQAKIDVGAARQMIDILTLLKEKTNGNLTPVEADYLDTHLGELKLAFVQRTKSI